MTWSIPALKRCKRVIDLMESKNLDIALISDPKNVYYLTGHMNKSVLPKPVCLCFLKQGGPVLLIGSSEREAAEKKFGGEIVAFPDYDLNMHMLAYPEKAEVYLRAFLLRKMPQIQRIGIEGWSTPYALGLATTMLSRDAAVVDISSEILAMRQIKDADEIKLLAQSCTLDDFAYSVAKKAILPGRREIDVYAEIYQEVIKKAGRYQFLDGDFVSGERSMESGGPPTARLMNEGETFILDLWVTTDWYWADTCRTFVVGGKPTDDQRRTLELLKEAMRAGEEKLRPGFKGRDVYNAVRGVIAAAGHGDRFPHHAGHGIGLDAWEPPFLIPGSSDDLKEGMVCALEPGVYIPGVGGIRIENNYLLKASGPESLTHFPLEL